MQAQYETRMYSAATPPVTEQEEAKLAVAFRILTWVVLVTCMVVWGVVGFLFWLPQLVREMILFSVALVHATLSGQSAADAGDRLKEAINFYRRGFELAYDALVGEETESRPSRRQGTAISFNRLLKETLWTVFVWWLLLSVLGAITWTPAAILRWILSGAWVEVIDAAMVKFWVWMDAFLASV